MRVAFPSPGRPDACRGGAAVRTRLRIGAGILSVYTRYRSSWFYVWFRLDAGGWLYAGRKVPVLSGQNWYWLVAFLLVAVLRRAEPEAVGTGATGYSVNKVVLGSWASFAGVVLRSSPSRYGGGEKKNWGTALFPGDQLCWSSDTANPWRTISAAFNCLPTLIAIRWLPKPVMKTGDSTSRWRPDEGLTATPFFSPVPSGIVPGAGDEGRCTDPLCAGGREGLDCFFLILFSVRFLKSRGDFVLVLLVEVPAVTCTCTAGFQ